MSADQLGPIRTLFFQECVDHLADLENGLLALESGETDPEIVNTVFRAAHSIKGGAAIFGMSDLVTFAHEFETVLAALRSGQIPIDSTTLKPLLNASDVLADQVDAARDGRAPNATHAAEVAAAFSTLMSAPHSGATPEDDDLDGIAFTPVTVDFEPVAASVVEARTWRLRLAPHAELYRKANDPLMLLGELEGLGALTVQLDDSAVPPLEELTPEASYLAWTIDLHSACEESEIRQVFEFVEGDCELDIRDDKDAEAADGAVTELAVADTPAAPATIAVAPPKGSSAGSVASQTIRVDLERVDRLIDLVSELVIGGATLAERVSETAGAGAPSLTSALDDLRQLTRDLQESVMAIRAQPMKSLFQRMSRLVREVEAQTGKSISLTTEGEETEVDRAVIERLTDPLTHMIRNAVDHGIETPQGRRDANKPAQGSVHIIAVHRAGRVLIEVVDDGAGINRDRVRAIAVERGLILESDALSDEEVENLIFEPGFSTAVEASELSGRGVGMDVVRRSVQSMGGRISVSSRPGQGASFSLSLPLTLAVMDGMLVSVRGQHVVVPLTSLVESVMPKPGDIRRLGADIEVMAIRGAHVPLIDLGDALDYRRGPQRAANDLDSAIALLVEDDAGERIALRVDAIVDQRQVVIKSLEANYRPLKGVAAATILGDGRVALIVDVNAIIASRKAKPTDTERQAAHA